MKFKLLLLAVMTTALAGCQADAKKNTPTQKEQAAQQWNRARAQVMASLAKSQCESGNLEKSQQTVDEAMRLVPEEPTLHVMAGKIALEQGQLERADRELTLARKMDPKSAEAEYLSGVVQQRWQKPEAAYECYLRANQKDPKELAYILARAEMLVAMNCSTEALTLLKNQTEAFEHHGELHHAIGQLQMDQKRYEDAVASLQKATMLIPEDSRVREHLAMAMFQNHQYRQAGDIYARLLKEETNSKRSELWVAMGECQIQLGRATEARTAFEKATQLNAKSITPWLSLAKTELQLNDSRRAESALRKALAIDAGCPEAHLMMGYTRLRQNRMNEALAEFQKASALDRADSVSLCMVGYVLEKTGKTEQAMRYYAAALKLKPNDELASRLMASVAE